MSTALLQAALEAVEFRIPPLIGDDFLRATNGAQKIAMHGNHISVWASLVRSQDPIHDCAASSVNISLMLRDLGSLELPTAVLKLVAEYTLIQALGFVHRAKKISVGTAELGRAQQILSELINEHIELDARALDTSASLLGGYHGRLN